LAIHHHRHEAAQESPQRAQAKNLRAEETEGERKKTAGEHEQIYSGAMRENAGRGTPPGRASAPDVPSLAGSAGESNSSLALFGRGRISDLRYHLTMFFHSRVHVRKGPPENMPPEKTPPENMPAGNMPLENMPPAGANMSSPR